MLVMETIAKIRRAFFIQGKSIKAICRELRVSRKVVRKVIRSGTTEFRYLQQTRSTARTAGNAVATLKPKSTPLDTRRRFSFTAGRIR
jgi:hypothetical protein